MIKKNGWVTLDDIINFKAQNNLGNNIVELMPFLGIINFNIKTFHEWEIIIKGPKNSLYEKGVFTITIYFPLDYPKTEPEVRFKNKIYHIQVKPSNGHNDEFFLHYWNPDTSIAEILIGIYLTFYYQNPCSPYSGEQARLYENNFEQFKKLAEEWTIKYATQYKIEEINKNENNEKKINELINKNQLLIEKIKELESKSNFSNYKNIKEDNNNSYKEKVINLLDEINELKIKRPIEILPGEKLISVIFQTSDFLRSIICKDTDTFAKVENLLYQKYPEYKETEQYFIVNGQKVNRFKTLKENKIKDSDVILMQKIEF